MIQNELQLKNTQAKLRELQEQYSKAQKRSGADSYARKLTRQSLFKMMNQLKEEIAVYQSHAASTSK